MVDLNCDYGESFGAYSFGHEELLLQYVTSVNIACGFHAGDPHTMHEAVMQAMDAGTAIGAHPGLPDRLGFGRREMAVSTQEVYDLTLYQIGALDAFVRVAGGKIRHVKPHGALYHMSERRVDIAEALVRAAKDYDERLIIYGQSGGLLLAEADKQSMRRASEVFADRFYMKDGTPMPRTTEGASLSNPKEALQQALAMVQRGVAFTPEGTEAAVQANTIYLHGDSPHVEIFASTLRQGLLAEGIRLAAPFAAPPKNMDDQ
ncbi:LamB/YcsF family protein [Paenibacillus nasutitermitis]|uniref:UPF0271 protein n=1 Tax=Paenibacillus nasutitermitis TaxID=1652958 RepID=A0A916YK71_9BACL|nr:5-oxoprolinase subunit PxpA [Paenibacillus nasutitermitis]GGD48845.1 UPF0271 protein [Paenibacillus nasutitermitis]